MNNELTELERNSIPNRIVVDNNGYYWRGYGKFVSMCPVSTDNNVIDVIATFSLDKKTSNTLTCVYCGMAYPEGTPPHGSKILTDHIKICEKHPLRESENRIVELERQVSVMQQMIRNHANIDEKCEKYEQVLEEIQNMFGCDHLKQGGDDVDNISRHVRELIYKNE